MPFVIHSRAEQIFKWIMQDNVTSFDDMTNLSLDLRNKLKENFVILDAMINIGVSDIYIYDAIILPSNELSEGQIMSPFCRIINETLKFARYDGKCGKRYIDELKYYID